MLQNGERRPICYAVMPYGSFDPEVKSHFDAVYQLYVKGPAEECGYQVIREDYRGEPGPIPQHIVKHLAEDDLVIADVSFVNQKVDLNGSSHLVMKPNFNVAYELGIRHAMSKRGTILIRSDVTNASFDVRHLNTIQYCHDLATNLLQTQQKIKEMIQRVKDGTMPDNEVHACFPGFANRMIDYLQGDNGEWDKLSIENSHLRKEIERLSAF